MGTIVDPSVLADLLQYGPPGLLFAFIIYREGVFHFAGKRWEQERTALIAQKEAAVAAERKRIAEDDKRKDRRIRDLASENEQLERDLDNERALRRSAEDGRAS